MRQELENTTGIPAEYFFGASVRLNHGPDGPDVMQTFLSASIVVLRGKLRKSSGCSSVGKSRHRALRLLGFHKNPHWI